MNEDILECMIGYILWINSTKISHKEKSFIITGNIENITSIAHKHHALNHLLT